jgi:hypothetical protein
MARTTDSEVKKIISLNSITDTTSFITTANLLVTQNLGNSGLSNDMLTEIEKYLTAHLLALHPDERQLIDQKLGDATDKLGGDFGKGLDFTQFGQTVKMLDTTGTFATTSEGQKSVVDVININI